ncbi:MAG TPA: ATP-binding cassette domain-containing protein [Vicinamibacterales bacterium]|nr:ATP-binding cassette domain-containing protein [Vicinamibacterales bacterium]
MTDAIALRHVTKRFGAVTAVHDLSLSVPRGSIYGFIGPNGSGKTTTLRMIMHIILPDEGEIEVLGSRETRAARDQVSYLPEERGLYKKMTVRRLLRYYAQLKGRRRHEIDPAIDEWMARMQLPGVLDRPIETLSKGMSQKVQFISAVISRPALLILDEPFSGLDPVNAQVLKDAVLEMRERGTTVVFSTHDMGTAERMCDRIFMIFKGHKVLDGTLHDIQEQYGADTVRIRTALGRAAFEGLPGIESINDFGQMQELRLAGDPQLFLQRVAARTPVYHFEITRPSLQDIFVRIAHPGEPGPGADGQETEGRSEPVAAAQ